MVRLVEMDSKFVIFFLYVFVVTVVDSQSQTTVSCGDVLYIDHNK